MNIELETIKIEGKEVLEKMLWDYELEITGKETKYKYFDSYWQEKNRFPFFIIDNKEIVGFVLVNEHLVVNSEGKNISEFYIKKEYRGKNIGREAAIKTFEKFGGKWEVREIKENPKARDFWRKVIEEYTKGNFKEVEMNNEKWKGWVQTFDNNAL